MKVTNITDKLRHDALYCLTDVEVDVPEVNAEAFTYDAVGNRKTEAGVDSEWTYNENNELLVFANVEYTYDENGNMTQITVAGSVVWTYTYNAANRLVHVEDGTGSISADYYYDPFGRRLWKDVGGTKTYFFYSDEGLIGEYDASGNELKTYGYKPDSTWTTDPLFLKQNSEYYFYQNDHLGTPQKLVGVNGAVVWAAQYSAFGKADVQVETVTNNLRFSGQYYDAETGLHYNWFRYYDPKIGRYLRKDPIGLVGGVNVFLYAQNCPLNLRDPMGLLVKEVPRPPDRRPCCQDFDGCYDRCRKAHFTGNRKVENIITGIGAGTFVAGIVALIAIESNPVGWVITIVGGVATVVGGSGIVWCHIECGRNPCAYPEPEPEGPRDIFEVKCLNGKRVLVDVPLAMINTTDRLDPGVKYPPGEIGDCVCYYERRGTRCEHVKVLKTISHEDFPGSFGNDGPSF